MPLNRDDIIGEINVTGSSGITCSQATIRINPITRNLIIEFNLVRITVLSDSRHFEESISPVSVDLTDGTGIKQFDIYNRRTGAKSGGGQTRSYDSLSRDLMSLYFDAVANHGVL